MSAQIDRARGRARGLNFEYSVCIALVCAFIAMLLFVIFVFAVNAGAENTSLDDRAGISSASRVANSQAVTAGTSEKASAGSSTGTSESVQASSGAAATLAIGKTSNSGANVATLVNGLGKVHTVTYKFDGAPPTSLALYNEIGSRKFLFEPMSFEIRTGKEFTVNSDYQKGDVVYTMDDSGLKKTGKFVFSGWSLIGTQTMPNEDLVITGTWTYEALSEDKPTPEPTPDPDPTPVDPTDPDNPDGDKTVTHKVSYSWGIGSEAPFVTAAGQYEDENGNVVDITLPASTSVEEGKNYSVNSTFTAGQKIYYRDFKTQTLQREWTFSGWSVSGDQTMGTSDVSITGSWTNSFVMRKVHYEWLDDFGPEKDTILYDSDEKEVKVKLPDDKSTTPGVTLFVDDTFEVNKTYTVKNEDGSIKGYWTFRGWDSRQADIHRNENQKLVFDLGDSDVTITGEWVYRSAE